MKKRNSIKLTKLGKKIIIDLILNKNTDDYHKTLLRCIKQRSDNKNLSRSDCEIFELISKQYPD